MSKAILAKAKAYCTARGARFTPLREKVYALMLKKKGPVGAYDLMDELKKTDPSAKPATIYRTLDFLTQYGFVHKLESTNAFIACHHFGCHHPVQFLICDSCDYVEEIQSEGLEDSLREQAEAHGFQISKQTIEAHGLCSACKTE